MRIVRSFEEMFATDQPTNQHNVQENANEVCDTNERQVIEKRS